MESVWVYIVAGLFFVLRFYLENKKKAKQVPEPEEPQSDSMESYETEEPEDIEDDSEDNPSNYPYHKQSLAEEFASSTSFTEGSSRMQHSSQFESDEASTQTDHNIHEDYSGKQEQEEKPMVEMDAEKMRDALIYQTILQRPDF